MKLFTPKSMSFFIFFFIFTSTCSALSSDIQHLISFKLALPDPHVLQTWQANQDPCNFSGVFCKQSRVSSLDLTSLQLNLDFKLVSSYLMSLEHLEKLSLKNTNLTGNLSSAWGSPCSEILSELDLAENSLSGSISDMSNLSGCKDLRFLNLSGNQFGFVVKERDTGVKFDLESLDLSCNQIAGGNVVPWIISRGCSKLKVLNLEGNKICGNVPDNLSSCSVLEAINLSNNKFTGELPTETFVKMSSLKKLVLSFNDFEGELPDTFSVLSNLEFLDLSSNNFSGSIPEGLCRDTLNNLKELYLPNNQFNGTIPATLSNCSQLITLDLSFNYLTGKIPASLGSLSKLNDLIMWMNQLEGEIPQELRHLKKLENLILYHNGLSGSIPAGLSNCTNLNWISLSSNFLSGEIPSWIGTLKNLTILKLDNNSFTGSIPAEIGDCESLVWLDLNSNSLSGSIPPTISKQAGKIAARVMTSKRNVYLKNDGSTECHGSGSLLEFYGIKPEGLDRVPTRRFCNFTRVYMGNTLIDHNGSMFFLDLSYNRLVNSIPKEIGNMYYLAVLNVGHNNLSGQIPEDLGNLNNVGILDLSHNNFEGTIPNSLSGRIDLSYNNLSGRIPADQLRTLPAARFNNNTGLCGFPLGPCFADLSGPACFFRPACYSGEVLPDIWSCGIPIPPCDSGANSPNYDQRQKTSLVGNEAMWALLTIFFIVSVVVIEKVRRKNKERQMETDTHPTSPEKTLYQSNGEK